MAKPRYAFTFTLGPEEAEVVERLAHDCHLTPTGFVGKAFVERLELERAGWKLGDETIKNAIEAIAGLKGQ